MSKLAATKIEAGLREALDVASGKTPAARIWSNGHPYVPQLAIAEALGLKAVAEALAPPRFTLDEFEALLFERLPNTTKAEQTTRLALSNILEELRKG